MKKTQIILGQEGFVGIVVVVTLSLIGTLGLRVANGPDAVNQYNNSLNRIRNENPTNEDMHYVADNLRSLTDAAGGIPIPTGADDVLATPLLVLINGSVEMGSKPIPDRNQGFGQRGQVVACGITVDKTLAQPGEYVTATIAIPTPFQSKISRIVGEAGAEGFGLGPAGGTYTFSIPCSNETNAIQVRFDAYDHQGGMACSGSVTVNINIPSLLTTLISPTGTINSSLPTYTWNAVCGATTYYLLVDDSTGRGKIFSPFSASEAGCASGKGTCAVTPAVSLANGNATWWIDTCHAGGCGPWSNALGFIVGSAQDPIVGLWDTGDGGQALMANGTNYQFEAKVTKQGTWWTERGILVGTLVWRLNKQPDGHYKGEAAVNGNYSYWWPMDVVVQGNQMIDNTGKLIATKVQ